MLEIEGLTKNFGGLCAVNNLDLSIQKEDLVGLIGPNGAGKTTVFNLVTGFLRPSKGKIVFEGRDITGNNPHYIAKIGIIRTFQSDKIFPDFTVLQNIKTACYLYPKIGLLEAAFHTSSCRKKEEFAYSRSLEIAEFTGLNTMINILACNLPHGYKRILGIAIALAAKPKLLILDEPLSGMNNTEVYVAIELIKKIWRQGITILLIEHNMKAAMSLCRRIAVLNFGKKMTEGPPDEIVKNQEVIQAYLGVNLDVT